MALLVLQSSTAQACMLLLTTRCARAKSGADPMWGSVMGRLAAVFGVEALLAAPKAALGPCGCLSGSPARPRNTHLGHRSPSAAVVVVVVVGSEERPAIKYECCIIVRRVMASAFTFLCIVGGRGSARRMPRRGFGSAGLAPPRCDFHTSSGPDGLRRRGPG